MLRKQTGNLDCGALAITPLPVKHLPNMYASKIYYEIAIELAMPLDNFGTLGAFALKLSSNNTRI